jgi:hypothetical protein
MMERKNRDPMKNKHFSKTLLMLLLFAAFVAFSTQPARTDSVQIVVNGSQVQFDQPPIERGGRVFVPLRGVFERLGASVVYDNGTINATGNGRAIQLQIGSTRAVVNGVAQQLDVAPFLVGARTLVPLRFISESLGANVQYDNSSRVVSINSNGQAPAPPPAQASVTLTNLQPGNRAYIQVTRPAVSGSFSQAVDPNSVRLTLDGRDVSSTTYVSQNNFMFTPTYDLSQMRHTVDVKGTSAAGAAFDRSWSFTSGATTTGNNNATNYLQNLLPGDGSTVGSSFTVSGQTLPNSMVHIAATGSALLGGILRVGLGTYSSDVQADGNGRFSQAVSMQVPSGGNVGVRLTSVAPNTNAGATVTLNLHV